MSPLFSWPPPLCDAATTGIAVSVDRAATGLPNSSFEPVSLDGFDSVKKFPVCPNTGFLSNSDFTVLPNKPELATLSLLGPAGMPNEVGVASAEVEGCVDVSLACAFAALMAIFWGLTFLKGLTAPAPGLTKLGFHCVLAERAGDLVGDLDYKRKETLS